LPKLLRLTAADAEKLLLKEGFKLLRSKGSHKIYGIEKKRITIPFHGNKILHPKITAQVYKIIEK
jgi:predicted RNA binding protein YcfA (HicA-like mRNA interferase family)